MATGLYRDETDWVMVLYDKNSMPMSRTDYEDRGYEPEFDKLPTKAEYEAKQIADRT
ncbi:MAG: hypothetical protein AB7S80_07245 [Rhizobiaceae bacterium]